MSNRNCKQGGVIVFKPASRIVIHSIEFCGVMSNVCWENIYILKPSILPLEVL